MRVDGQLTYAMIDGAVSGFDIAYVPESIFRTRLASATSFAV